MLWWFVTSFDVFILQIVLRTGNKVLNYLLALTETRADRYFQPTAALRTAVREIFDLRCYKTQAAWRQGVMNIMDKW